MFGFDKKEKKSKTTYGIIGVGRFGRALATELASSGAEILVIDRDEEKIRDMRELTENAYIVKNLDKESLLETGIQNCDVAVVCIAEKIDTSILTTLHLSNMHIPRIIAKASGAEHGEILEMLGAEVVYPERDMAIRLANRLEISRVLDYMQLSEKINISKTLVPEQAVGKTVIELNIRSRFNLNIIAVENSGTVMEMVKPDYVFRKNDILFVSGSRENLEKFYDWAR